MQAILVLAAACALIVLAPIPVLVGYLVAWAVFRLAIRRKTERLFSRPEAESLLVTSVSGSALQFSLNERALRQRYGVDVRFWAAFLAGASALFAIVWYTPWARLWNDVLVFPISGLAVDPGVNSFVALAFGIPALAGLLARNAAPQKQIGFVSAWAQPAFDRVRAAPGGVIAKAKSLEREINRHFDLLARAPNTYSLEKELRSAATMCIVGELAGNPVSLEGLLKQAVAEAEELLSQLRAADKVHLQLVARYDVASAAVATVQSIRLRDRLETCFEGVNSSPFEQLIRERRWAEYRAIANEMAKEFASIESEVEAWHAEAPKARRASSTPQEFNLEQAYEILNVPPRADIDEIKAAYRMLQKLWHTDRKIADSDEKIKSINNAYSVIRKARNF